MRNNKGRLTIQQRALVKGLTEGLSVPEAAKRAGYCEASGKGKVYSMLRQPHFQSAISAMMQAQGLGDDVLLASLKEGLEAMKTNAAGQEQPDHATRHRFLETALKVRGGFAPVKSLKGNISFDLGEILKAAQEEE